MFSLLTDWQGSDVAGWMLSEKLDGFRMMWTGREFVTRSGKVLDSPAKWTRNMPKVPLDGELYAGRGGLYEIKGLMKRGWSGLSFQVFDAPGHAGGFVDRLNYLQTLSLPDHCSLVRQAVCGGAAELQAFAVSLYSQGGEGGVIRDPGAIYAIGRTKSIQRLVPYPLSLHRRLVHPLRQG